jgi:hypothetical protein
MSKKGFIPACIILFSFIALCTGCATMNDVVRVKEDGSEGTTKRLPCHGGPGMGNLKNGVPVGRFGCH